MGEKKERIAVKHLVFMGTRSVNQGHEAEVQDSSAFSHLNEPRKKRTALVLRRGRGNTGGRINAATEKGTPCKRVTAALGTHERGPGRHQNFHNAEKVRVGGKKNKKNQAACVCTSLRLFLATEIIKITHPYGT